jgi:hypothetical protein
MPFPVVKILGMPISLQFGGKGGDNRGRVFGMGLIKSTPKATPNQLFRADYHGPHGQTVGDYNYLESNTGGNQFHYHITKS